MAEVYGAPAPLSGAETVTVLQYQNGHLALCTVPIAAIAALAKFNFPAYAAALGTTLPETPGIPYNNGNLIALS